MKKNSPISPLDFNSVEAFKSELRERWSIYYDSPLDLSVDWARSELLWPRRIAPSLLLGIGDKVLIDELYYSPGLQWTSSAQSKFVLLTRAVYSMLDGAIADRKIHLTYMSYRDTINEPACLRSEVIKWAEDTGIAFPILSNVKTMQLDLSEKKRDTLLKQIAGLALALAEKHRKYKRGDKPNAKMIAEEVHAILSALPDINENGWGSSSIRASIADGLKLLEK